MSDILQELYTVIKRRRGGDPDKSYVAKLFARGSRKIAAKVGEEAVETVIAALKEGKKRTVAESADLLFHLLVLWAECGVTPKDVEKELRARIGKSGLDEKIARKKR